MRLGGHPTATAVPCLLPKLSVRPQVEESVANGVAHCKGVQMQIALVPNDDVELVRGSHLRWDTPAEVGRSYLKAAAPSDRRRRTHPPVTPPAALQLPSRSSQTCTGGLPGKLTAACPFGQYAVRCADGRKHSTEEMPGAVRVQVTTSVQKFNPSAPCCPAANPSS